MKRTFCLHMLAASVALAPLHAATDAEVDARRVALELAGAFANDGFKLRDGVAMGTLEMGKPKVVQVNLYAGNEYWFSLAGAGEGKKVAVSVFDETGVKMDTEPYQQGATAAAGFSPGVSGSYFVKVELVEGATAAFCLLYSYK
ncbi:MAG: hypothetical protein WCF18_16260 [Chthoniobacteraceae bacterium]